MGYKIAKSPSAQVFDIPLIGDDLQKIGRVLDLYADACSPHPTLWVLAFWQAVPTAFISLKKPELIDINIAHRRGKPRKGKKFKFNADFIFRDAIVEIPVPRWVPFQIWELGQRIGYYFLVADVAENFLINWSTLAYKYEGCKSPFIHYLKAVCDHSLQTSGLSPGYRNMIWNTQSVSGINFDGETASLHFAGTYRCTWSVTWDITGLPPGMRGLPQQTAIFVNGEGVDVGEDSVLSDHSIISNGSFKVVTDGQAFIPNLTVRALWAQNTDRAYATGVWNIDRVEDNELAPDP